MINDVLDMSKIESGKMMLNVDILSLREVMDNITNIVQSQIKAKKQIFDIFIKNIQTEHVYCDGTRLTQVLLNILSNAIKFTPERGTIHVALTQEDSPLGEFYVRNHFGVRDTGIGMSPEFQKNIFDSFAREDTKRVQKVEGTGLGMAITKHIVDAMKGAIELKSEVNKGTEFHIILDMERNTEKEEDMLLSAWNVLVVDDDEQLCHSAASSLKKIGVKVDYALDGETAVEIAATHHKEKQGCQIVLLDWKMPGMDGIVTAYDWNEIEEEARKAGVNGFLSKPLFKSTLFYGLRPFIKTTLLESKPLEKRINFIGMLGDTTATGFVLAVMMSNSGSAWDNAKKYIEGGAHGGKGSEAHKAAVVGDTVGDPFKDTPGSSLNILIKLMSMVAVVFTAVIVIYGILQ